MTDATRWRSEGVTVMRADRLETAIEGKGRATAFGFAGTAGRNTWIGTVTLPPRASTGAHHHGNTEVVIYVVTGRTRIRWGERLEFSAEAGPGDFIYFAPHVPHQEENLDANATLDFVVVRSNPEGIAVALDIAPVEHPETVA